MISKFDKYWAMLVTACQLSLLILMGTMHACDLGIRFSFIFWQTINTSTDGKVIGVLCHQTYFGSIDQIHRIQNTWLICPDWLTCHRSDWHLSLVRSGVLMWRICWQVWRTQYESCVTNYWGRSVGVDQHSTGTRLSWLVTSPLSLSLHWSDSQTFTSVKSTFCHFSYVLTPGPNLHYSCVLILSLQSSYLWVKSVL